MIMNQPRSIGRMTIRNWWLQTFVGRQCSNKPWNWGQETGFGDYWQDQRDKSCEIIDVVIPECWKVSRPCEKISKNVGCKNKVDSGDNGGFRISTNEFEKQLEGYRYVKGSGNYKDLDKTQVKLFPNLTSIPFDYLLISWVTNYVGNLGFLTCLSWIVSIEDSTLSNV